MSCNTPKGLPTRSETSPRLMDEHEVALRFGLSVKTLRNWRVRGVGPRFLKIGRAVRYRESELTQFEDQQTFSSTSHVGGRP